MSVVDSTSLSSEERPIGMVARSDLVVQESVYQGEKCWIVKDPLAMKYFRLMAPEHHVLTSLQTPCSYLDLKNQLDRLFPEKITRLEALQNLVVSFHRNGLLKSESSGQAKPLRKRRNRELKQKLVQLLSSIVSLKLPGFDPEFLLTAMYRRTKWAFSTTFTCVVWMTILLAASLVIGNLDEFFSKLPDFQSFFAFDNLVFMGTILIFTKTIHEFGHGLMCHHYGGECHEIGFMLLVMTPAMYCNTSDSWVMPNRWHRMAIGAAGMYVELFTAAPFTFVWWFTNPSWLHYLALNIMFLSSVSTLIFNANPLLRYDGYFILSDFLEIPNLSQKSKLALTSTLRVWCLGMEPVNSRLLPQKWRTVFALYSVVSFAYRWAILFFIMWFLKEIFEPWGLAPLAYLMISMSAIGMLVMPCYKMIKFFLYPGRLREMKRLNFGVTLFLLAAVTAFICYFPFEQHVHGSCRIRSSGAQTVYTQEPGILTEVKVKHGEQVKKGQVLAVLENREYDLEVASLKGQLARLEHDLTGYELNRNLHLDSERLITETQLKIESTKAQIDLKMLQAAPLVIKAPRSGVVVAAPNVPQSPLVGNQLRNWSGIPLDPKNLGALFEPNTVVCMVADHQSYEGIIVLDQSDVNLIEPGQPAKFCIEQYRDQIVTGEVLFASHDELEMVPRELSQSNGGPVAIKQTAEGGERPLLKSFEVYATVQSKLPSAAPLMGDGFYGNAKIKVGHASLGRMLVRYVRNLVNFR